MMDRRQFLMSAAAALPAMAAGAPRSKMGVATTCFLSVRKPNDAMEFLEYCNTLGAGGIQAPLKSLEPAYTKALRKRADELGMYLEVFAPLPKDDSDAFAKYVQAAKDAGASCLRCGCLSGRRYETFSTYPEWKEWVEKQRASVIQAASVVEKLKMPLALENHKDWTSDELAKMMKQLSSEYMGVCLDTGNNMALLEEPMHVVETLAPYTIATHVKDMAMAETKDGFELSEVVFGEGMLDMSKVIGIIRAARPKVHITLEMITRDPLKVPCLTTKYWATFPDRSGYQLVKFLQVVRSEPKRNVPHLTGLDRPAQLKAEEDNVKLCLDYANRKLSI